MAIVVAALDGVPFATGADGAPPRPSARRVIGPTMPSTTSPLRAWKSRHRAARHRAEHAVGGDAQRALDRAHVVARVAALELLRGGRCGRHRDRGRQQRGRHLHARHPVLALRPAAA